MASNAASLIKSLGSPERLKHCTKNLVTRSDRFLRDTRFPSSLIMEAVRIMSSIVRNPDLATRLRWDLTTSANLSAIEPQREECVIVKS